ncbi:MAG: T9SS type A sorting domain-containing protein [Bacteroidota bacterium]|nr:T9SS type A sorting domain-containing protein [Bacteroidota bacterium]
MNKTLFSLFSIAALVTTFQTVEAQTSTAFAITGETKGSVNWSVIREIDLTTGALVRNIYLPASQKPAQIDASTGKELAYDPTVATKDATSGCACQPPSLAAATAYDAKQKRLYFTTLFGNDLQYIDVTKKQLKVYHITAQKLKPFTSAPGEGDNITRMVFGADGNGYAITNNGNHFIRFTTGKNVTITDMGSLVDKANNTVSVHTQSASWGGDLVADDMGNLYLFTVAGHVFTINPTTREAQFVGTVQNLPKAFSINAAAVNKEGKVTVASSTDAGQYFSVDMESLIATPIVSSNNFYNASDFANSNLLVTGKSSVQKTNPVVVVKSDELVNVYPNPVKNKLINLYFNGSLQGKHALEVVDASGKRIAVKTIELTNSSTSQTIQLPYSTTAGMYIVHVLNMSSNKVFTGNVVVE